MTRTARAPLSRERILDAAVAIADAEGLAAVTMRGVAQQLDCEAMSLYYHVKDKAQLVTGLVEVIIDEVIATTLDNPPGGPQAGDWRDVVRARCLGARHVMLRHPWAPPLVANADQVPPNTYRVFEALVATMIEAGFSYDLAHRAIHAIGSMILGFTQELFDPNVDTDELSDDELAALAGAFPHLGAIAASQPHDAAQSLSVCDTQAEFEFTLGLVLDGLDALRPAV
ncbi:MAG: TetR family transcriptional regulator [Actinobacteria bacterium HGW-Actinobacteria-2]|nr:MAG: TetR family transcriptional regulator [Actinobacteria bacterium HGW-Actinobacteria-2]